MEPVIPEALWKDDPFGDLIIRLGQKGSVYVVKSDRYKEKSNLIINTPLRNDKLELELPEIFSKTEFLALHFHILELQELQIFLKNNQCILNGLKIYRIAKYLELKDLDHIAQLLFHSDRLLLNRVLVLWAFCLKENDEFLKKEIINILTNLP